MNSTVKALGKSLCKWAHNHLIILKEANDRKMLNDSEFLELWNIKEENEVAFSRNLSLIKQSSSDLRRS
jgi:predicted DNA-binding ArsR family transcriptional regulator